MMSAGEKKMWLLLAFCGVLLLCGCFGGGQKISGHIGGAEGKTIYLEQILNNRAVRTDSTVIGSDGNFTMQVSKPLELNFYWLRLSPKDFVVLITDSTECIEVKGEAGRLNEFAEVSGSENTQILRDLEDQAQPLFKNEEELSSRMRSPEISPEMRTTLAGQLDEARKQRIGFIRRWLESNSSTPAAIAALQMIDPRTDGDLYKKVVADLGKTFAHSVHYKMLRQQVEHLSNPARVMPQEDEGVRVAVGKPAPEIAMPDPSGKMRKLSDLRGKTVLIDFWASWCGPCRRENPNVVEAYKKYKKDGFEVFSVSLDRSADLWKQAIDQDKLIWPNHVSDLKQWENKAAADYGVHSIPFPVLVDKDGNVIAYGNNVRGAMLTSHLEQIYGQ